MKWNIGSSSASAAPASGTSLPQDHPAIPASSRQPPASCPMHQSAPPPSISAAKCPVPHNPSSSQAGAKCPIQHDATTGLNPLNSIPLGLSAVNRAPGQVLDLPTERTASTIPRPKTGGDPEADTSGVWEYPSPQQFYNALVRKGWETPEESIEMVVAIHNFLNERAWEEVMKWEKRKPGGEFAQLARFQGRPGELSPKARMALWAGWAFPSKFNSEPPFDRHDWVVTRPSVPASTSPGQLSTPAPEDTPTISTRYVIDYYSAPPDEDGNPVFSLDVRPALDSFESVSQRVKVGLEEFMKGQGEA